MSSSISKSWTSFQHIPPSSSQYQEIKALLDRVNFPYLCAEALRIRQDTPPPSPASSPNITNEELTCTIDKDTFTNGMSHVVLELKFSDATSWIARVRMTTGRSAYSDREREAHIRSEITTMRLVAEATTVPVPTVYGFDPRRENEFGAPWVLMQVLPGCHLDLTLALSVPREKWKYVAGQLAYFLFQLSEIRFRKIGRITCEEGLDLKEAEIEENKLIGKYTTSLEWFYETRRYANKYIKAHCPGGDDWNTACWILEKALPSLVLPQWINGPFPLCHTDLHINNILIDTNDWTITGIIDWSGAQTVPIERFLITPEFLVYTGGTPEQNAKTVEFREIFAKAFRRRELAKGTKKPRLMADMIGTKHWDLVFRCTYSRDEMAREAAIQVMRMLYGDSARWGDFVRHWREVEAAAP